MGTLMQGGDGQGAMRAGMPAAPRRRRLAGLLAGIALTAIGPTAYALAETEPGLGLPLPPDVTVIVPPASPETSASAEIRLDLPPEPGLLAVEAGSAPQPKAEVAAPAIEIRPDLPPEPTVLAVDAAAGEGLRFATELERRLADPQLPLPPKVTAREREGIAAFYAATDHRPLWIADGAWTRAADSLIDRLGRAEEDGLDPADYPVPNLSGGGRALDIAELADAELKLSAAAYLYARAARGGRLEPNRVSALVTPQLELPSPERVLSQVGGSTDAGEALQGFNPAYPGYRALREKLAEIRSHRPAGMVKAKGAVVASASDTRLPSGWSPRLEGDIVANMERWRWLPSRVADRYILVNVPEYQVRLVENGAVAHEARVIIGKPNTPTPIFSDTMDHAVVNPSWYIPPSILRKEILPGLAKDPDYAAKRGYTVTRRGNVTSVRQPPGPRNALGYIKLMFPNDHAVYLHDTPNRNLFSSARRAFSHGCVRVQNPFSLAGKILGNGWSEARLKSLIGRGERTIFLEERMPIHLAYFTTSVDEATGRVSSAEDVYGIHRRVRNALGLGG
ncbi:L,D-transpeptidase family protein [Enterovirga rhinocerotis]|uniref:L,D-transpeptidase-like protein n=1 Tax=Enterovirga rhinocerotis TaxID=1339210 RepID=A0A4R7BVA0_9HYPH|nr:L,D-transpeptidase family protein [Enterovirga rhinocerotis]TDR89768.1 L,D-transpeptidase-like protein [Enterovirga rhinocerotis]